jgi:hypothetical protein
MTASAISRGRARLVDGLPAAWHAPALLLLVSRPWGFLLAITGALAVALPFTAAQPRSRTVLLFGLAGVMLPVVICRGIIAGDRTRARWVILFQRPVRPVAHYARAIALAFLLLVALFAFLALVFAGAGAVVQLPLREIIAPAAGGLLMGAIILCLCVGVSAVAGQHELELVFLVLFLSYVQGVFARTADFSPMMERVLEYLLPPLNGVVTMWRLMLGGDGPMRPEWYVQLILYPAACLTVAAWRLLRWEQPEAADRLR